MDFGGFWEPTWEGKSTQDRSKIDPKGHQKNDREKRASWKRLGGVLGLQNPLDPLDPAARGRGGGDAGATPRKDSGRIRIIRKGYHKEVRKDRRLEYGTPYAMRRHKAWRGGSKAQQSCVPATALDM